MKIPIIRHNFPKLSTEQMIEVDRLMMEEYHIALIQMMENAGRCLAITARERFLEGEVSDKNIIVLAGTGGNGGGALVAARRLATWGAQVSVYTSQAASYMKPVPLQQLKILQNMGIEVITVSQPNLLPQKSGVDLILDGIIGYSLSGNPRGSARDMIEWANAQTTPTLALDTPSGVSLTTGQIYHPAIKAEATLTLALPKVGLFEEKVKAIRGDLFLGDISVPPQLYAEPSLSLEVASIFSQADVLLIE